MGPLSGFGPLVIGPNFIIGPMTSLGNIIVAPDSVGTCQDSEGGDDRTFRPQLRFNVFKSGFFVKEPRIGKDGLGHGQSLQN